MEYNNKIKLYIFFVFLSINCSMKHDYTLPGYISLSHQDVSTHQYAETIEQNKCTFRGWFAKEGNAGVVQLIEEMEKRSLKKIVDVKYETIVKFRYYIPFLRETCIKLKIIAIP
ncbi:hypothetical protein [Leptospira ilyithenensis]|uniref:Uncharacterized protein n=1 Tax=Leptospira ilyithenensis TaxID=2484901 RepID=A0A4R9LND6_9LEPT|nr:hypothetical protein [Leptospira ilyithenensis]TGN10284.1 hypothetical protein EHS11_09990 [Leptospira ilyithenensis]